MLNLIKLELRKNKITGNVLGGFIATFVIMAFIILMSYDPSEKPFASYEELFFFTDTFVSMVFIVFASVLVSKLIIDEYKNKSVTVLFMYPIQRKKLLVAKLTIVVLFTFGFGIIARTLIVSGYYLYNHYAHFIPGSLTNDFLLKEGIQFIVNSAMASCIGLVPLYFGMRRHSVPATIVSAVILASALNSTNGTDFTLSSIVIVPALIAAIGIFVAYWSIRNVEMKDVA